MKIESIIELYPYIDEIIGYENEFALGGYPSLVKQGILEDNRDTGDIDLCVYSDIKYNFEYIEPLENRLYPMIDSLNHYFKQKKHITHLHFNAKKYGISSQGDDVQNENLLKSLGVNKVSSIWISSTNVIDEKLIDLQFPKRLIKIMNENDATLGIDIFMMPTKNIKKTSIIIDGIRYVNYYVILKAKYEYCLNKLTNQSSFDKHINDLVQSYKKVHIIGINSPKDIEFLLTKRNEVKENSKENIVKKSTMQGGGGSVQITGNRPERGLDLENYAGMHSSRTIYGEHGERQVLAFQEGIIAAMQAPTATWLNAEYTAMQATTIDSSFPW